MAEITIRRVFKSLRGRVWASENSLLIKVRFFERNHLLHAGRHVTRGLLSVWDQIT